MKKEKLEELFDRLQGQFDVEEPEQGHRDRFLSKLKQQQGTVPLPQKKKWWGTLSIAASVVLLVGLSLPYWKGNQNIKEQVVEIAPEVSQTEFYFANLVEEQISILEKEKTPETAQMVDDTLSQLDQLDADYKKMERDLLSGGNKELILNAMIINFQTRIDLLKEVLTNIKTIKNLKSQNDENFTI